MEEIKKQLQEKVSSLKSAFSELNEGVEWSMSTELYPKCSAVFREIEILEEFISKL